MAASCSSVAAEVHVTSMEPGVKSGAAFRRSEIDKTTSAAARAVFAGFSTAILTDLIPSRHSADVAMNKESRRQLSLGILSLPHDNVFSGRPPDIRREEVPMHCVKCAP